MPATFGAVPVFVAFAAPGLVFFLVREAKHPQRTRTDFRETAAVLLAGLASAVIVLMLLGLARLLLPHQTPDLGRWVREGSGYLKVHYVFLAWWILGLVLGSCLIAAIAAALVPTGRFGSIKYVSAWWQAFHDRRLLDQIYVGCFMDDGSWVGGWLLDYNTDVDDIADREIVLAEPIHRRSTPGSAPQLDVQIGLAIVSARKLVSLQVAYYPIGTQDEALATGKSPLELD